MIDDDTDVDDYNNGEDAHTLGRHVTGAPCGDNNDDSFLRSGILVGRSKHH